LRVLHIITGLNRGGAEGVLYRLISNSPIDVKHCIVGLIGDGYYSERMKAEGFNVHVLGMPRGCPSVGGLISLYRLIKDFNPLVIQTWMYHGDLIGGLVGRLCGVPNIVWGIRHSNLDWGRNSSSTRVGVILGAALSRWIPRYIVSCSEAATTIHEAEGYVGDRFVVIPNGYDTNELRIEQDARKEARLEWDVGDSLPVIGMVARWDPQKDHINLLDALLELKKIRRFRCVLFGKEMDKGNKIICELIAHRALSDYVVLCGETGEIRKVMNGIDLHVLSSLGEGFPNTVAEAMACGTPCVVTDVGDAARIVGDTGVVVPLGDPLALARGIDSMLLKLDEDRLGVKVLCRRRIVERYSIDSMIARYSRVWASACGILKSPSLD
jgi:glycosyltransferase involved in cell wall biosynthesis